MASIPAPKGPLLHQNILCQNNSGIALFMVIASISVLAILVTEFTYIAQVSQSIAFGGLDQTKAHYLAKSGFKISLLRLKGYQQAKGMIKSMGGGNIVQPGMVEKIWNFPFMYPLPTAIPGLSVREKDAIDKFQKDSNLEGSYTAIIESESSKYNLNMLLAPYAPSPSPNPSETPTGNPSPLAFDPDAAQNSLRTFLGTMINQKFQQDPDFAANYRDFRLEDFIDGVTTWADRDHERRTSPHLDRVPPKRAPFYSLTELHMVPLIDDELYELIAPSLTVNPTPGININTMKENTLRALIPQMTPQEVTDFFKYRDSQEVDHLFKEKKDFFAYMTKFVGAFANGTLNQEQFEKDLKARNIYLVTEETQFKITVRAQMNQATETIEAWVTLLPETPSPPPLLEGGPVRPANSGLRITYMRIY